MRHGLNQEDMAQSLPTESTIAHPYECNCERCEWLWAQRFVNALKMIAELTDQGCDL
jgi:hypothetical protein